MLSSILAQSYENIEVIMVNDGSTDDTLDRLNAWVYRFRARNYTCKVFTKTNGGAASAINVGLKNFSGTYVCFPDADDILSERYAATMVSFLENNKNFDWVRCSAEVVDEENVTKQLRKVSLPENFQKDKLIEEYMLFRVDPVVWLLMARGEFLKKHFPLMNLYESPAAQEWQLVLPLSFYGICGHIDDVLYTHINYKNSHFHTHSKNSDRFMRYMDLYHESQTHTLDILPIDNRTYYDDIRELGFINMTRLFGSDRLFHECAGKLHSIHKKYIGNTPPIESILKESPFFLFVKELECKFLNIKLNTHTELMINRLKSHYQTK